MDIEIFDGIFDENFDGKKVPFVKSKGFIIIAAAVALFALYVFFKNRGTVEQDSAAVSEVAYYTGQQSSGGGGGSYVNTSDILSKVQDMLNNQNESYNERFDSLNESTNERFDSMQNAMGEMQSGLNETMSDMRDSFSDTIDDLRDSISSEERVNINIQTGALPDSSGGEVVKHYTELGATVDYNDNMSEYNAEALEQMAKNSVLWHQTDDPKKKAEYAAQNQMLGQAIGAKYDAAAGKWYDPAENERLYHASTDWDAGTETFGK